MNNAQRHTPGPWLSKDGMVYDETNGDTIAITGGNVDGSPCANAKLIAASPDLLDACKAAHGALGTTMFLLDKVMPDWRKNYRFGEVANLLDSAISKAGGEMA